MKKRFGYDVKKIGEGIFLVNEMLSTMYVINGTERALVIDCGTGVGDFKALIESLTSLPYDVVATHAHVDHIGGRGQFGDIYISATDSKKIKSVTSAYRKFYCILNSKSMLGDYDRKTLSVRKITEEPTVHIVREGDSFALGGGRTVEVYETPGHTNGSVSLLLRSERMFFTGDVVNPVTLMFLTNAASIDTLVKTVDKLYAIDGYDIFWQSHATENAKKDDMLKLRTAAAMLQKKKNSFLPIIKKSLHDGYMIICRANNIH